MVYCLGMADVERTVARDLDSTLWVPLFLDEVRRCGVVSVAAKKAGVSSSVVVAKRRISPGFDDAVKAAIAESVDELESEARARAMSGSDKLIIEFLRAKRPEEWKRPEAAGASVVSVTVNTVELLERVRSRISAGAQAQVVETTAVQVGEADGVKVG